MHSTYRDLALHRWMLRDGVRNESYRRAITHAVTPGSTVLDMGAGSGVLSIFAARAGASKVFAVERTDIAELARRMAEDNGVADRIEVMHIDLEDAVLPQKVDVLISEWMGGLGVDENMLAPLVMARDRWLVPGGKIIPASVTAWLAPAFVADYSDGIRFWRSHPHDLELGAIAELTANESFMTQSAIAVEDLFAPAQAMWTHDAFTCTLDEADRSFTTDLTFTTTRAGEISALVTWFTADMGDGSTLTNAVGEPDTHWGRLLMPLDRPINVRVGSVVHAQVACDPSAMGSCELHWLVTIDNGPTEEHDTRRGRRSKRDQF